MIATKSNNNGKKEGAAHPAFRSLIRTLGLLRRVMEPYFARHGISASQWAVLRALNRAEEEGIESLRVKDLSERVLVRPPSMTGAIDRLQRSGLVAREASPGDQRAKQVMLTPAGHKLVRRVRAGHSQRVRRVLSALTPAEQAELHRLLSRLGDHLDLLAQADTDREQRL